MERINGLNQVIETLRKQLSENSKTSAKTKQTAGSPPAVSAKPIPKISSEQLQKKIAKRLSQLDNKADNYYLKATDVLLESILVWEFGDELQNDPRFTDMVTEINAALQSSSSTKNKLTHLINDMANIK